MSSTVFVRGSEWSATTLLEAWGEGVSDEQAEELGDLVVARFEELAAKAGDPSIHWIPRTSEVIGECYGETRDGHHWSDPVHEMDADLDELREQAMAEVWDAVCGYETPMSARVRDVFNIRMTVTEAAERHRVPRASITWAIRRGELAAEKNGRAWEFWSNDFEDWLAGRPGRGGHRTGHHRRQAPAPLEARHGGHHEVRPNGHVLYYNGAADEPTGDVYRHMVGTL